MGADIHLVLEEFDPTQGVWVGRHNFPWIGVGNNKPLIANGISDNDPEESELWLQWRARQRKYRLFGILANVRGAGPEPKGLPPDASTLTLLHLAKDSDLHSHTWYSLKDACMCWLAAETNTDGNLKHDDVVAAAVKAKMTAGDEWLNDAAYKFFGVTIHDWNQAENFRVCIAFDN